MRDFLFYTLIAVLLVLSQIFVFNQIHLFGFGCVFIYVLFIVSAPLSIKPVSLVVIGFLLGLSIDIFSNSYGINTAATTLIAYIRPKTISLFFSDSKLESSVKFFGNFTSDYYKYLVTIVAIHHFTVFMLEAFTFSLILLVLLKTVISTISTAIFIFFIQSLFFKKK
jgi:rod shape-determining protein MreD